MADARRPLRRCVPPSSSPERPGVRIDPDAGLPRDPANVADALLQLPFGVPILFVNQEARFPQIVELAELVRHTEEYRGHRFADRVLAVGNDPGHRHRTGRPDRGEQLAQILLPGRE